MQQYTLHYLNQNLTHIANEIELFCLKHKIENHTICQQDQITVSFNKTHTQVIITTNKNILPKTDKIILPANTYIFYKETMLNKILKLNGIVNKIHARKCLIKRLTKPEIADFINQNHLLGYCNAYYKYGLFYNNNLVMAATFSKSRTMLDSKVPYRSFELIRVCTYKNFLINGGLSKLIHFFIDKHHAKNIMTYIDLFTDTGEAFYKIGFKDSGTVKHNKKLVLNYYQFV